MQQTTEFRLVRIFYIDVQYPRGKMRKYLTSQYDVNRWSEALNSIHALINGIVVVGSGYETIIDMLGDVSEN